MRFVVATCEGYLNSSAGSHWQQGLSAHVLDSDYGYRLVALYRSEDSLAKHDSHGRFAGVRRRGREGALTAAREYCRRLNG